MTTSSPRSRQIAVELADEEPDVQVRTAGRITPLLPHLPAAIVGLLVVVLLLVWSAHDGGYDADTWYWGSLLTLSLLSAAIVARGLRRPVPMVVLALGAFALYVAWSYLSILWAQAPGQALEGSNRALMYLMLFALLATLPWTTEGALAVLTVYVVAVGALGLLTLARLATGHGTGQLIFQGRLLSPTGYFNSTAALFTIDALMAVALAVRRSAAPALRAALIAMAAVDVQLAILAESRGWLFTLPVVIVLALLVVRHRLRIVPAAVIAIAGGVAPLHRLLAVYRNGPANASHTAAVAGRTGLALCAVIFIGVLLMIRGERLLAPRNPSALAKRRLGTLLAVAAVAAVATGAVAATSGHPVRFLKRQWNGFVKSSVETRSSSYFGVVGSGRYDFWRVSLDALAAHPLGGLGQDNFDDYYLTHRRTAQEPQYTHSIEMRLLAHTGLVGFLLFAGFLAAAITAALGNRRSETDLQRLVAGAALLALIVWLIHGSVDWFWEIPALSGPALGFLAVAGALGPSSSARRLVGADGSPASRVRRGVALALGFAALLGATVLLAFPYLSVREVSIASNISQRNPVAALRALSRAAQFNPLSAVPDRLAGTIALQTGEYSLARTKFQRAISRDSGGWLSWLGAGLAATELGDLAQARHDFEVAYSINPKQPAVPAALRRIGTAHPLTPSEALRILVVAH